MDGRLQLVHSIELNENRCKLGGSILGRNAMSPPNLTAFRDSIRKRVEPIPCGKVLTYAHIGGVAPANVGAAMKHLVRHFDADLPWHRVVNSDGSLSKKIMHGQRERLEAEGIECRPDGRVCLKRFLWKEA